MCSTSTTLSAMVASMWILDCKLIEWNAGWMITSGTIVWAWLSLHYIILTTFRLILIAEKDTVYDKFPTPLINRLEKHFVLTSSVLNEWQKIILKNIEKWVENFSNPGYVCYTNPWYKLWNNLTSGGSKFKKTDAFVGFQKDIPASVVFHASKLFELATKAVCAGVSVVGDKWDQILQWCNVEHGTWYCVEEQQAWTNAVSSEVCINIEAASNHFV